MIKLKYPETDLQALHFLKVYFNKIELGPDYIQFDVSADVKEKNEYTDNLWVEIPFAVRGRYRKDRLYGVFMDYSLVEEKYMVFFDELRIPALWYEDEQKAAEMHTKLKNWLFDIA